MRPIRVEMAVALTCAVALLGACSDDEPEAPPTSTTSSSPSISETTETTPAPTPPSLPPEATTPDAAGAAAFVRHWFNLSNYAYATGETEPLLAESHPDCGACRSISDEVESRYERGGHLTGGIAEVLTAEATAPDGNGIALVTTSYDQSAIEAYSSEGSVTAEAPAEAGVVVAFYVQWQAGNWTAFGQTLGST